MIITPTDKNSTGGVTLMAKEKRANKAQEELESSANDCADNCSSSSDGCGSMSSDCE